MAPQLAFPSAFLWDQPSAEKSALHEVQAIRFRIIKASISEQSSSAINIPLPSPAIPCHPLPFLPVSTITSRALDGFGAFHVLLRPDLGLIHNAKVTTCLVHFHCKKYLSVSPVKLDQIGVSKDDSSIFVTTLGEMTINPWDLHGSPRCPDRLQRLQRLSLCIMKDGTKQQIVSLKS